MTRRQRLLAALRGEPVDRVPVVAWMHFGSEHLSPAETAQLHARFQRAYDWDWVKVMADYHFEVPADVLAFDSADKIDRLRPPGSDAPCFRAQQACLVHLQQALGRQVPLFDSGYDPYQMLLRHIGRDQAVHLWQHARRVLDFLDPLADAICTHIQALKDLGIAGYFHATNAAVPAGRARGMTDEVYERLVRPFDLRILQAAEGMVRVLHAHGSGIDLKRLSGYPFEIIQVSDRDPANPSLAQLQRWTGACVMGGIDEAGFSGASRALLASQVEDALRQTNGRRFILAPGCVLPSSSSAASLRFLRDSVDGRAVPAPLTP